MVWEQVTAARERAQRVQQLAKQRAHQHVQTAARFRSMAAQQAKARKTLGALRRAVAALETLDRRMGAEDSVFWVAQPELVEPKPVPAPPVAPPSPEYDPFGAVASQPSGEADPASVSVQAADGEGSEAGEHVDDEPGRVWLAMSHEQRLDHALHLLRSRHMYCLFCGCHFDSSEDMADRCPGPHEEDHE